MSVQRGSILLLGLILFQVFASTAAGRCGATEGSSAVEESKRKLPEPHKSDVVLCRKHLREHKTVTAERTVSGAKVQVPKFASKTDRPESSSLVDVSESEMSSALDSDVSSSSSASDSPPTTVTFVVGLSVNRQRHRLRTLLQLFFVTEAPTTGEVAAINTWLTNFAIDLGILRTDVTATSFRRGAGDLIYFVCYVKTTDPELIISRVANAAVVNNDVGAATLAPPTNCPGGTLVSFGNSEDLVSQLSSPPPASCSDALASALPPSLLTTTPSTQPTRSTTPETIEPTSTSSSFLSATTPITSSPETSNPGIMTRAPTTTDLPTTTQGAVSFTPPTTTTTAGTTTPSAAVTSSVITSTPESATTEMPSTTPVIASTSTPPGMTTTQAATSTPEPTTTEMPSTTPIASTSTPSGMTTTQAATSTPEPTTTEMPSTTPIASTSTPSTMTTTLAATSTPEPTTTEMPSTTPVASTSTPSTMTTTQAATSTPEPTTTEMPSPTSIVSTSTPSGMTTAQVPTRTPKPTTTEIHTTTAVTSGAPAKEVAESIAAAEISTDTAVEKLEGPASRMFIASAPVTDEKSVENFYTAFPSTVDPFIDEPFDTMAVAVSSFMSGPFGESFSE